MVRVVLGLRVVIVVMAFVVGVLEVEMALVVGSGLGYWWWVRWWGAGCRAGA